MAAEEVEVCRSVADKRLYRKIVLRNTLQVLLISDPSTNQGAASMSIGVGSFKDPDHLEGLARLLQLMLAYGSEKCSEEDSYFKYVKEHGGSHDAFASFDQTRFCFGVDIDSFEKSLARFAGAFIKPLFPASAISTEVNVIESAYRMNLFDDDRRMNQLQKHLCSEDHPFHRFQSGNLETLKQQPRERGLNIKDALEKFYKDNYSANLMRLAVYTKDSLDKIQKLVEEQFSDIQNINQIYPHHPDQPCKSERLPILVKTVPIRHGHKLRIVWPVNPEIKHYEEGPLSYICHLIGQRGKKSLYYILKTRGWATALYALKTDCHLDFGFFTVVIDLTDAGHDHMQHIIGLLFKYIQFLQDSGVRQWIFDEFSTIRQSRYNYLDRIPPIRYVDQIASNMQLYPPNNWLVGSSVPRRFDASVINEVLDQLSPDNVQIFWESKKFEGDTDKLEPWYGTAYSIENITSSMIEIWVRSAPMEDLDLPAPNEFIPTEFSLMAEDIMDSHLRKIESTPSYALWYRLDIGLFIPKAFIKMAFNCPYLGGSSRANVLTDIFRVLLMDYLDEYGYCARIAGLHYAITRKDTGGFEVYLFGFNDKLEILLKTIVEEIARFTVKEDRFLVIKEIITQKYQDFKNQQPYEMASWYLKVLLQHSLCPWIEEGLNILPHLQAGDLKNFVASMLGRTFLDIFIAGNIKWNQASSIATYVEKALFQGESPRCKPFLPDQFLPNRVVQLESGKNFFYSLEGLNPDNENFALLYYIQVGRQNTKMKLELELFELIAGQPANHELQSVDRLGYINELSLRNEAGIWGVQFIIQSTTENPVTAKERVEAFLERFDKNLLKMGPRKFQRYVKTLTNIKLGRYNLQDEAFSNWREIVDGTAQEYRQRWREISELKKFTIEKFGDFFRTHIKGGPSLRIQIYGKRHSESVRAEAGPDKIDDIFSFKKSQFLYASFKCHFGHVKFF